MKIAFTLCSRNYLPRAKALGDSLLHSNPDYRFIIGLIDCIDDRTAQQQPFSGELLEVRRIGIPHFPEMVRSYSLIELITAVKPFFFAHFFQHTQSETVVYLDPDIVVYRPLAEVDQALRDHDIVLTPHVISPNPDDRYLLERLFLKFGLYNLGFIAVRRGANGARFIRWWSERTAQQGYIDTNDGMFVDQLWVNLAPLFFEGVYVEKNPGFNMAWWNLHERVLTKREGVYWVNDRWPLVFFHFSNYDPALPAYISTRLKIELGPRPDLTELFEQYRRWLLENNYEEYRRFKCRYDQTSPRKLRRRAAAIIGDLAVRLLKPK